MLSPFYLGSLINDIAHETMGVSYLILGGLWFFILGISSVIISSCTYYSYVKLEGCKF